MARARKLWLYALAISALPSLSLADTTNTTDLVQGIGTNVPDAFEFAGVPGPQPTISIHTSIKSVTYSDPVLVNRPEVGLNYYEVHGSITGIGWGGFVEPAIVSETFMAPFIPNLGHYSYNIPFLMRWPVGNWEGTLDVYSHSTYSQGQIIGQAAAMDPSQDDATYPEREGDLLVSDTVLRPTRSHAFFSANAVVQHNATYAGLTAASNGQWAAYAIEGPNAGTGPANSIYMGDDAAVGRDWAQLAKRLISKLTGKPVQRTLGYGHSGSTGRVLSIIHGRDVTGHETPDFSIAAKSGDNFNTAYDPTSGKIYDGFISFHGACTDPAGCTLDPEYWSGKIPLPPLVLFTSNFDDAFLAQMGEFVEAQALASTGLSLSNYRTYTFSGAPHNPPDVWIPFPNTIAYFASVGYLVGTEAIDGVFYQASGLQAPVVAKVIDNMVDHLKNGTALLPSWIDGTLGTDVVNGVPDQPVIVFNQYNRTPGKPLVAGTIDIVPFLDDPSLDTLDPFSFTFTSGGGYWYYGQWPAGFQLLTSAAPYVAGPLVHPYMACRLGSLVDLAEGTDMEFSPFPDPLAFWGNYQAFDDCVDKATQVLADAGLWDADIARTAAITSHTDNVKALFGVTHHQAPRPKNTSGFNKLVVP